MQKAILSRPLVALIVASSLALIPAVAQARPVGTTKEQRAALSLPQRTSLVFGNLWLTLTSLWGNEGMTIDPSGQPAPPTGGGSQAPSDHGASIGPDGLRVDSDGTVDARG
jgi:hypothetical protein